MCRQCLPDQRAEGNHGELDGKEARKAGRYQATTRSLLVAVSDWPVTHGNVQCMTGLYKGWTRERPRDGVLIVHDIGSGSKDRHAHWVKE